MFFADDLLLFAESSIAQMDIIRRCLADFEQASGQKVSFNKSSIFFSPNINKEEVAEISSRGGIPVTEDLGRYLGVYLVHGRHQKQHYQQLMDKVSARLKGWKMKTLSLAGRETLASSVMTSMPIFQMQTARMPQSVLSSLDKHTEGVFGAVMIPIGVCIWLTGPRFVSRRS